MDAQLKRKARPESKFSFGSKWRNRNVVIRRGSRCREVGGAHVNASLRPRKRRPLLLLPKRFKRTVNKQFFGVLRFNCALLGPAGLVYSGPSAKFRCWRCVWTPVIDAQFIRISLAESTVFFSLNCQMQSRSREISVTHVNTSFFAEKETSTVFAA